MANKSGGYALPVGVLMALVVACLWTMLTGSIWHWVPVVVGIVVALGAAKASNTDVTPPASKKKKG